MMAGRKKKKQMVMGAETEFSTSLFRRGKLVKDPEPVLKTLIDHAAALCPSLRADEGGRFFPCGRIYIDPTGHLETATRECESPAELVRTQAALCGLVRMAWERLEAEGKLRGILSLANLDYSGSKWGFHENFSTTRAPKGLVRALTPFLVTAKIFGGAGGLNPACDGLEFSLSPTSHFIVDRTGWDATSERVLIHYKEEPLAEKCHRLHLTCEEALASHFGLALRFGATAVVAMLADMGFNPAEGLDLVKPLDALRVVAADPTLTRFVETRQGKRTALMVQRRYLEYVKARLDLLPDWAPLMTRDWESTLDQLQENPARLEGVLDWPLKLRIFREMGETRHGIGWHEVAALKPDDPTLKALKNDLIEADILFSQPEVGYYAQLDRQGQLSHRLPLTHEAAVQSALREPAAQGRAGFRSRFILDHALEEERFEVGWEWIRDRKTDSYLDLANLYVVDPTWRMMERYDDLDYPDFDEEELASLLALEPDLNQAAAPETPDQAGVDRWHAHGRDQERGGSHRAAEVCYRRAMEMAEAIGYGSMATHCRWHLASLHAEEEEYQKARALLEPLLQRANNDPETDFQLHLQAALLLEMRIALKLQEGLPVLEAIYQRAESIQCAHNPQFLQLFRQMLEQ